MAKTIPALQFLGTDTRAPKRSNFIRRSADYSLLFHAAALSIVSSTPLPFSPTFAGHMSSSALTSGDLLPCSPSRPRPTQIPNLLSLPPTEKPSASIGRVGTRGHRYHGHPWEAAPFLATTSAQTLRK